MRDSRWCAISEIVCPYCFRHCRLADGATGRCRARANIAGESRSLSYGQAASLALDPIEKKPLVRFYPGSMILSTGTYGCNLSCPFCQNFELAGASACDIPTEELSPGKLTELAVRLKGRGNIGAAYTYNEPMVGFEYVRDCAKLIREAGMKNVVVTNGSVADAALDEVLPYVDAYNIDLKGFTEEYYKWLGGDLETVKHFIRRAAANAHVELTTLIVPGKNDGEEDMDRLAEWVASIGKNIPLHITRFFPRHLVTDRAPTPIETLRRLRGRASKHLSDVILGNV